MHDAAYNLQQLLTTSFGWRTAADFHVQTFSHAQFMKADTWIRQRPPPVPVPTALSPFGRSWRPNVLFFFVLRVVFNTSRLTCCRSMRSCTHCRRRQQPRRPSTWRRRPTTATFSVVWRRIADSKAPIRRRVAVDLESVNSTGCARLCVRACASHGQKRGYDN